MLEINSVSRRHSITGAGFAELALQVKSAVTPATIRCGETEIVNFSGGTKKIYNID